MCEKDTKSMSEIHQHLTEVFRRALRCDPPEGNFKVSDLAEWDSLTHIKLVMELEMAFEITIGPDDIPGLYSDYDTVCAYVERAASDA